MMDRKGKEPGSLWWTPLGGAYKDVGGARMIKELEGGEEGGVFIVSVLA